MLIRRAQFADIHVIAAVQVQSWHETYTGILPPATVSKLDVPAREALWAKAFEQKQYIVVAEMDGQVVGFANGGHNRNGASAYLGEIYSMYIIKPFHGQGIGAALFKSMKRYLVDHGLVPFVVYVLAENPAHGFYLHMGGKVVEQQLAEYDGHKVSKVLIRWR